MKIESRIHCGHVISCRKTERGVFTETSHDASTRLARHAHSSPHLAILLQGSYFEKIDNECFLRLPGDKVFYPEFLEHENRFGRLPARCLNVEAFAESPQDLKGPELLERLREKARGGELLSLSAAAREAGYHPVYLSRLFRKIYGVSFGEYVKTCRLRRSADLIFRLDLPLAAIALEAGYYDQSHLTNELASSAGFTPGELRHLADN